MRFRFVIPLFVLLAACTIDHSTPAPVCSLPNGGTHCDCPGTMLQPLGCDEVFTCRTDSTWAPYDAACLTAAPVEDAGEEPDSD